MPVMITTTRVPALAPAIRTPDRRLGLSLWLLRQLVRLALRV